MLETIWFVIWGVAWAVYFMLDGFDLGLGTLLPFLAKDETERVAQSPARQGYDADWLNGDLEQKERERELTQHLQPRQHDSRHYLHYIRQHLYAELGAVLVQEENIGAAEVLLEHHGCEIVRAHFCEPHHPPRRQSSDNVADQKKRKRRAAEQHKKGVAARETKESVGGVEKVVALNDRGIGNNGEERHYRTNAGDLK